MRHRATRLATILSVLCLEVVSVAAQGPASTELPGKIFSIQKTWTIGGEGDWDYLTLDPGALQLFIAHGAQVQVVDVNAGAVTGAVTGLRDAHGIALDNDGQFGYISDGAASEVAVFSRSTLRIVKRIPVCKSPRAVVFEPASQLVFAVCPAEAQESRIPRQTRDGARAGDPGVASIVTIVDAQSNKPLADVQIAGKLGFAQADGNGRVYVNVQDRNEIASLDSGDFADRLRKLAGVREEERQRAAKESRETPASGESTLMLDWTLRDQSGQAVPSPLHRIRLGMDCLSPRGLAIDSVNARLFVACDNAKMDVVDAGRGTVLATLTTGPGSDGIAYDADRDLVFVSNGGGLGSLTVIRTHITDSYAVIQQLPTRQRARTLAVNRTNGQVYLVTNLEGFDLSKSGQESPVRPLTSSTHTLPVVPATAVAGSFQVLVVGN